MCVKFPMNNSYSFTNLLTHSTSPPPFYFAIMVSNGKIETFLNLGFVENKTKRGY